MPPPTRSAFSVRDALLLGLLALLWGNSFLLIKIAVDSIAPAWIVAGRLTIGGLLLVGLVVVHQRAGQGRGLPRAGIVAINESTVLVEDVTEMLRSGSFRGCLG